MKLTVLKNRLYKGCLLASKIISTKSNLPILGNISLTANEQNGLLIESSNLELSIRLIIPAKVEESGQTTVPARKFTEYLGSLKDEKVSLDVNHKQIAISSSESNASFVTMPAEDFPVIPAVSGNEGQMIIPADEFNRLIKRTVFAAATSDIHPVLSGVLFDQTNEGLYVVATDSFRLSISKLKVETGIESSFVIPANALAEVSHLLGDSFFENTEDKVDQVVVKLSPNENQAFFNVGSVELISRLLEVEYPDYKKVIPSEHVTQIKVNKSELIQTIRRTAIFASREGQAIKVNFDTSTQLIEVSAQSVEVGSQTSSLPCSIEGETLLLGFNHRYLVEGLESFSGQEITILGKGVGSAVVIHEGDVSDFRHVIMPMNLIDEEPA